MKKILITIIGIILLLLAGCTEKVSFDSDYTYEDYVNSTKNEYNVNTVNPTLNPSNNNESIYLEVQFGNGEVLRTEVAYFMVPRTISNEYESGSSGYGFDYCKGYFTLYYNSENFNGTEPDPSSTIFVTGEPSLEYRLRINKLSTSGAILTNGMVYNFHEAYDVAVNNDTKTVRIYVWRDEPYQLEREYFTAK